MANNNTTRKIKQLKKQQLRHQAYELHLNGFTQIEIAQKIKKSQGYVSELINETLNEKDFALGRLSIEQFLSEYHKFRDFCSMQQKKLALMQPEDQDQQLKIMELQQKISKDSLAVGSQGQFMQAVKAIRDGKLQLGDLMSQLEEKKQEKEDKKLDAKQYTKKNSYNNNIALEAIRRDFS